MSENNSGVQVERPGGTDEVMAFLDSVLQGPSDRVLPPEVVQKLFTVAVQHYSRGYEDRPAFAPMLRQHVNATDVSTCCIEMLRVVDLELFELTFWGGRLQDAPQYENR
jgi:hypothetical protein